MKVQENDLIFMKKVLPNHYNITIEKDDCIRCKSTIGIQNKGNDDKEHWDFIFKAIKQHFKERFSEVFCHTCTFYLDFCVYIRK